MEQMLLIFKLFNCGFSTNVTLFSKKIIGVWGTDVNLASLSLNGESLEITRTVPFYHKFGLSVCLFVCLFVSNKRQNDIFCENPRIIFVLFYDVHKENMFTINLEDGREAPSKAS